MADLRDMAKVMFYAGPPTEAHEDRLVWDAHDYSMEVLLERGALSAKMTSGNCEWTTPIETDNLKDSIDAALKDACNLGRTANYSRDPDRD